MGIIMSSYKINLHISVYYVRSIVPTCTICILRKTCVIYSYRDEWTIQILDELNTTMIACFEMFCLGNEM